MNIPDDFVDKADAYLTAWTEVDRFSGSVLVAWDDAVVFERSYGFANREHSIPNSSSTKFRIGSITKQFTAAAILVLQEQGKLAVTDLVSTHLDDCPKAWTDITLHHLLNHSSGIPNYTSSIEWATEGRSPLGVWGVVNLFRDKPLEFAPGSRHSYSNSGYHLLGCVIEKVSGRSFETFLNDTILGPLGMEATGLDHATEVLPGRASGYGVSKGEWVNADYLDTSIPYAAGGMYSTTGDLWTWSHALDSGRLLSEESTATMESISPLLTTYGYGVQMRTLQGRHFVTHGGGIHGFRAHLLRSPEHRACVVVLTNLEQANPKMAAEDLVALLTGKTVVVPPSSTVRSRSYDVISLTSTP